MSAYDKDPEAVAWAAAKVARSADKAERFSREAASVEQRTQWRKIAWFMRRELIGGTGCVIAGFDARLPEMRKLLDGEGQA